MISLCHRIQSVPGGLQGKEEVCLDLTMGHLSTLPYMSPGGIIIIKVICMINILLVKFYFKLFMYVYV